MSSQDDDSGGSEKQPRCIALFELHLREHIELSSVLQI